MAQQNLDFNIVAHTKGMEAIANLINRVGALEAETKKLAAANAGLSNSTDAVIRNGARYNNAIDAQSKALRNARQGTQQLGMQINDFATSISTGASVTQAFNQQLGQVGYALSMMSGTAGRVGAFLAGPWGAAITIATVALGPYITKLIEAASTADRLGNAIDRLTKLQGKSASVDLAEAQIRQNKAREDLLSAELDLESRNRNMPGTRHYKQEQAVWSLRQEVMTTGAEVSILQERLDALNKPIKTGGSSSSSSRSGGGSRVQQAAQRDAKDYDTALRAKLSELNADGGSMFSRNVDYFMGGPIVEGVSDVLQQVGQLAQELYPQMVKSITGPNEDMIKSFDSIGMAVNDAFKGMLTGGMSWKDGMKGIIQSVIDELWRLFVVQQIVGMISGGLNSLVGGIGAKSVSGAGAFMKGLDGTRAGGGPVRSGGSYLVGERGPELFVPNSSGTIIPNHRTASAGGATSINVTVDARGSSDPAAVRAQVQQGILEAAPAIIAAAQQRTVSTLRRPKLGGAMQ